MPRAARTAAVLALLVLTGGCYRAPIAVAGPEGCGSDPGPAVIEAVNVIRADRGRAPLQADPRLSAAAARHSADMARYRFIGHTGRDGSTFSVRARDAGYDIGNVGEVVAAGHQTPGSVVDGWLRSRAHREILLLPTVVTIGAACAVSARGALYWTAVVGARRPVRTVADESR